MASNINPVTGNPYTNAEKAEIAAWEAKYVKKPFVPNASVVLQRANWSAAGVAKAAGAAKPLEKAPAKANSKVNRNTTGGTKLSFRKTRKSKARKSRKSRK
jgi:inosine-uridine nucleoside N-ribohydrolase